MTVEQFIIALLPMKGNSAGKMEDTKHKNKKKIILFTFLSNHGQLLMGYQYSKENQDIKGVVVMAHGLGGGGQNTYMDVADYFASNGYLVFAYDATGNDKSEGDSVEGLPQGVILWAMY